MYIHEQTNLSHRQHRTKYIPWNTLNAISDQVLFQLALKKFINNLSLLARSIFVPQNGGAFLLEFSPCLEFRLKTDASLSRKSQLHARNRNDSRSRDEIVSSLFRSGGRFTWIILVPLVNEYPSPRNKGQQLASSVPLENDILLSSCYTELLVVRESGQ